MSDFRPLGATPEELEARQVLRDGVPASMRSSLVGWLVKEVSNDHSATPTARLRGIENNCEISLGLTAEEYVASKAVYRLFLGLHELTLLNVAHYLAYRQGTGTYLGNLTSLETVLAEGRSKWKVGRTATGHHGLVERVPAGVQAAAESLIAEGGAPGELLAKAWGFAHDLHPNDSSAYAHAVKAVEAAALPLLGITSPTATITQVTLAIEAKDATWRLPFKREHTAYPSRDVLLGMLKSLYRGQRDRHGSEAYSEVTHDEALAAVLMSVTLVGLFAGGLVEQRDVTDFA